MAALPASLPYPRYVQTVCGSSVKSASRVRGSRTYPLGRVQSDRYVISWLFTAAEYQTWETFYRETTNKGTDWFDMQIYDGQVEVTQTVRLTEPAIEADASPLMSVRITVECFDRTVISSAAVDSALGV